MKLAKLNRAAALEAHSSTTPKKNQHKHTNIRLNIINVINNNKKCLKCNNYMANHSDRFTCSYCNMSLKYDMI